MCAKSAKKNEEKEKTVMTEDQNVSTKTVKRIRNTIYKTVQKKNID